MLPLHCDYVFKYVMRTQDYVSLFSALLNVIDRPKVAALHAELYSCENGLLLIGELANGEEMAFIITFTNDEPVFAVSRQLLTSTYYHYEQLNLSMPVTQLIINNYVDSDRDDFYVLAHTLRSYPNDDLLMDVFLYSPILMRRQYEHGLITFNDDAIKWLFLLALQEGEHCPFHLPGDFLYHWQTWSEDPHHVKCFKQRQARIDRRIADRLGQA